MLISRSLDRHRSLLTPIHPILKIGVCLFLISFTLLLRDIWAIGVLVSVLILLLLYEVPLSLKTWATGAIAFSIFLIFSTWLLGSAQEAVFSALRLLAIALPAPLLAGTTPPANLIRALQASRLPSYATLSLMLIWRFLPIVQQETQRILEANQLRGVNLFRQPQQWFSGLVVPLIFQIVAYADEVTIGLQTRGYDPTAPRSNSQPLTWTINDALFGAGLSILLAAIGYLEWGN